MVTVCIFFYSKHGGTQQLAEAMASGAREAGAKVCLRRIPCASYLSEQSSDISMDIPSMTLDDLSACHAFAYGSPSYFGVMAAEMKAFWDSTTPLWLQGSLIDKPAGAFTSSASLHGGQESTLLGMMLPLFHHGCCCLGLPYSQTALHDTQTGGTPYGPSHLNSSSKQQSLSAQELSLAKAFGARLKQQAELYAYAKS